MLINDNTDTTIKSALKDMRIVTMIQARMGSTRLPGKVMFNLCGKPVLLHVIERIKQSKYVTETIVVTSTDKANDEIRELCSKEGIFVYSGSENDVLDRFYQAAKTLGLGNTDLIVRVTADCPLIDYNIMDKVILKYINSNYEIVSNAGNDIIYRTFPRGLDVEVFSFKMLAEAFVNAKKEYQKEHVTPYIYENSNSVYYYKNDVDYSRYRWTLDTEEDWDLISSIYDRLYFGKHDFGLEKILDLLDREPELHNINKHIEQKKL